MTSSISLAKIRGTHQYSFRSGQWANVIGVCFIVPNPNLDSRLAYIAQYPDGEIDYIPVCDSSNYEISLLYDFLRSNRLPQTL